MAAASALNVVRQIQALAEGPRTPEMLECLGQVASALVFFLDHPDSRVRLGSARTLTKLKQGYHEEVQKLDLARAKTTLARLQDAVAADGAASEDDDARELREVLEQLLGDAKPAAVSKPGVAPSAVPSGTPAGSDGRGEVILKVGEGTDPKVKAAILEKVVALSGVVSVTFEVALIIVSTRTPAIAADASFLADLLVSVKEQGLEGASLISAAAAVAGASNENGGAAASSSGAASPSKAREPSPVAVDDDELDEGLGDDAEPAYLDDDDDDDVPEGGGGPGPAAWGSPGMGGGGGLGSGPLQGGAQWSFFSQNNWMTGRRLQEFGDDPTIAARLAAAKRKEDEQKQQQQSRLGAVTSWLTGSR